LPGVVYKGILKVFGESAQTIENLIDIKATGISIERFENALRFNKLKVIGRQHYVTNPIYQYKFAIKPRKQSSSISHIPYLRDFVTSCSYYLVRN
jgi:hypothetical protein